MAKTTKTTKTTKRDAIYARYSSHNQDQGTSIEVQLEACHRVAEKQPKPLEYIDRARTGLTMARDSFRNMLHDAEAGKFTRLIVYDWSRFGRNAETHATIADLEDLGIQVISATEGTDYLARGIGLVVSADYSRRLADRSRAGNIKCFQKRGYAGGPLTFGYHVVNDKIAINEQEAAIVKLIFDMYTQETIGAKEVANRLNSMGHRTRKGKRWSFSTIAKMLKNTTYTGLVLYNRQKSKINRRTGVLEREWKDEAEIVEYRDESLRIIDDATFNSIQERMAKHSNSDGPWRKAEAHKHCKAFTGLLNCSECGGRMYRVTAKPDSKSGKRYYYYRCGRRLRLGLDACPNNVTAIEPDLLKAITAALSDILDDSDTIIEKAVAKIHAVHRTSSKQTGRIKAAITRKEKEIAQIVRMMAKVQDDDATFDTVKAELASVQAELADLKQQQADMEQSTLDLGEIRTSVTKAFGVLRERFDSAVKPPQINRIIADFVGELVVQPDGSITPRDLLTSSTTGPH